MNLSDFKRKWERPHQGFSDDLDALIASEREAERNNAANLIIANLAVNPWEVAKRIEAGERAAPPDALYRRDETCAGPENPWRKTADELPPTDVLVEVKFSPGSPGTTLRRLTAEQKWVTESGDWFGARISQYSFPEWRYAEGGEPAKDDPFISVKRSDWRGLNTEASDLRGERDRLKAELAAANANLDTVNIANAKHHAELKDNRCEMARLRAELEGHAVDSERLRKLLRKVQNIAASGDVPF